MPREVLTLERVVAAISAIGLAYSQFFDKPQKVEALGGACVDTIVTLSQQLASCSPP